MKLCKTLRSLAFYMSVHEVFQEESAILGGGFLWLNYMDTTKST
jgi:hypothetical protein